MWKKLAPVSWSHLPYVFTVPSQRNIEILAGSCLALFTGVLPFPTASKHDVESGSETSMFPIGYSPHFTLKIRKCMTLFFNDLTLSQKKCINVVCGIKTLHLVSSNYFASMMLFICFWILSHLCIVRNVVSVFRLKPRCFCILLCHF